MYNVSAVLINGKGEQYSGGVVHTAETLEAAQAWVAANYQHHASGWCGEHYTPLSGSDKQECMIYIDAAE